MEEKDYIFISDEKGNNKKMELVLAFNSADGKTQYIIYKETDKIVPVYMAKVKLNGEQFDLDTNLTDEERKLVEEKFKEKIIGKNN